MTNINTTKKNIASTTPPRPSAKRTKQDQTPQRIKTIKKTEEELAAGRDSRISHIQDSASKNTDVHNFTMEKDELHPWMREELINQKQGTIKAEDYTNKNKYLVSARRTAKHHFDVKLDTSKKDIKKAEELAGQNPTAERKSKRITNQQLKKMNEQKKKEEEKNGASPVNEEKRKEGKQKRDQLVNEEKKKEGKEKRCG